jgi:hypothetical protein
MPGRYKNEFVKAKAVNAKIVKKYFHDVKVCFLTYFTWFIKLILFDRLMFTYVSL